MKKHKPSRLSPGELEILEMLWRRGAVTLSQAQAGLEREIGYTTVQTRLNRLVAKGIVSRTAERPAQYTAAVAQQEVSARHLDLMVQRVTGGSVVPLVAHLVRDRNLTPADLAQLKQLIGQAERQARKSTNGKK